MLLTKPRVLQIAHFPWRISLKWYARLTLATAISVWALIVLGGSVRVTDSGTGCGSTWPMCDGHLLPALEYHQLVEWNHRLFATLVGLLMAVTVGVTLLWYRRPRRLMWLALLAAATYIGQALLGGITVLMHLDHTWVAAHMGNSMLLLGSVVLLALYSRVPSAPTDNMTGATGGTQALKSTRAIHLPQSRIAWLALGTLLWTYIALFTGSAVVGAGADVACPSWPQCAPTHLLPITYEEWINFTHRLAVGLSDVLLLLLGIAIWRTRRHDRRLMRTVHVLALLYVSQVFLGAFTVWLGAPEALKGAHLALAAATWAVLVLMVAFIVDKRWIGDEGRRTKDEGQASDQDFISVPQIPEPTLRPRQAIHPFAWVDPRIQAYFGLIKPRVIPLLLVPTVAAMLMAAVQRPTDRPLLLLIVLTMLGGTLAAGGAHAINQWWERDIDARMKRTKRRAVVTGQIAPPRALLFGIGLSALSFGLLWLTVNLVAALLAIAGNLFYVFVYTMWLKRSSVQNIVIGGAAGAVPPMVGWAAVTGRVDLPALLFFAIIFFWTPAHFWALSLVRQEDYRAAGIPMLPVVRGEAYTRKSILLYALLLVVVSLLPVATQSLSWLYLAAAVGLGTLFVVRALQLARKATTARAWGLFKFSNVYLALLYLAMVLDRLAAIWWGHGV